MTDTEMDLNLRYRGFIAADKESMFHSAPGMVPSFHDVDGNMYCAVTAYHIVTRCPRIVVYLETPDLAMFGTMIVAGSTPDHTTVLILDTVGPTVDAVSPVDLQHVVGLSLGLAANLSLTLPPADLALAVCDIQHHRVAH